MYWVALFLILAVPVAAAPGPTPPATVEGYALHLIGLLAVTALTTVGSLGVAAFGFWKDRKKENGECKATPCFFGKNQHEQLRSVNDALHYVDGENTQRPVLSGMWRKQADERAEKQTSLLERMVELAEEQTECGKEQTQALKDLTKAISDPPKGDGGMKL